MGWEANGQRRSLPQPPSARSVQGRSHALLFSAVSHFLDVGYWGRACLFSLLCSGETTTKDTAGHAAATIRWLIAWAVSPMFLGSE